jgi:hypothetical protein
VIRAPWISHFGFTHSPFSKAIPASQLCERPSLQEAVARIRFTIAETQLGVLTGEVGVGKTVAIRAATSQLDPAAHHIIYVPNPAFGTRGLYVTIVRGLGAIPRGFRAELMAQAQGLLAAEEQERRRRVVLIVDEAHLLTPDQLEELRLLTNAEMDSQSPLPCSWSANRLWLASFAWVSSPHSTSGSPCATSSPPWTWANRSSISTTIWLWLADPTHCSPTTPSPACIRPASVCLAL